MTYRMRITWILLLVGLLLHGTSSRADKPDEGMWLPIFLEKYNEAEMKAMGFELTAEEIYNVNNSSIKDAIMCMGGGFCTGELVSNQGLLFTNHHCGYDAIAKLSTVENDYLNEGFWARDFDAELPVEGLYVRRLVRMEDVTEVVNARLENAPNFRMRQQMLRQVGDSLKQLATDGETFYEAELKSMFAGSEHYLQVYEVFNDVRLVGTPPSSIGKFGGDTDNWMWPRHTGDFCVFRVYANADNEPAAYSPDNKPYKPRHYLPISMDQREQGDFSMIMGYPGTTERYLTSMDVSYKLNLRQPALMELLQTMLKEMEKASNNDKELALDIASDKASLANYEKYLRGQSRGLRRYGLISEQQEEEERFRAWVAKDPKRKDAYGDLFSRFETAYNMLEEVQPGQLYTGFGVLRNDAAQFALKFNSAYQKLKGKEDLTEEDVNGLKEAAKKFFEGRHRDLNREMMASVMVSYYQEVPESQQPFIVSTMSQYADKFLFFTRSSADSPEGRVRNYVDMLWETSILLNKEDLNKWLDKPKAKALEKDPFYEFVQEMLKHYQSQLAPKAGQAQMQLQQLRRTYVEALRKWKDDKKFYPDANSTLRLTYGSVRGYEPEDAKEYAFVTTHYGIIEKEDPDDPEFKAPDRLIELLEAKDFGPYGKNKDTLVVNFLTNNDITGGNSGSPVMDENGHLIGLAFDGNWEAMTGDIMVNPNLNRTICVDIRYVLFVIDKVAGARRLIDELDIRRPDDASSDANKQAGDKG